MTAEQVSPSKWDLHALCFRRGGFRYVAKLPDPGGEGARRGTRVHGLVEDYLQTGVLDPDSLEGAMAHALTKFIPAPGTSLDLARRGVVIEGDISFEHGGVQYNGRKDLEWWDDFTARRGLVVTDYKTTSNFAYALTLEQLRVHVQPITYAAHSFWKHTDQNELRLEWDYVLSKRPPQVRPRVLTVTRDYVEQQMTEVIDPFSRVVIEMISEGNAVVQAGGSAKDWVNTLPYDTTLKACEKYGKEGCPFRGDCAAHGATSATERVRNAFRAQLGKRQLTVVKGDETMNVELLKAAIKARGMGLTVTKDMTLEAVTALMAAKESAVPVAEVEPVAAVAPKVEVAQAVQQTKPAFVPPQGRTFSAPPLSPGHNGMTTPITPIKAAPDQDTKTLTEQSAGAPVPPPGTAAPDQETKSKATRAPRVKSATTDKSESPRATTWGPSGKFTLLVNTLAQKQKAGPLTVSLSEFLAPVHAAIKEAHKVSHYMAIQYVGRAVFAEAIEQYLTERTDLDGDDSVFVDARTPEGADALPVLERFAGEIYRGV